jgi:hypothetical protein
VAGTGGDTLNSSFNGSDTYQFGSTFGSATINNPGTPSGSPHGEVDFTTLNADQLWFEQSGNNLIIEEIGTNDKVTFTNWFYAPGDQVESFNSADGLTLDSQVTQLVTAMASFASNNPGFDPSTAIAMPTDTTLQAAITASWHS